jgi:AcrR family transcriptional regulator
VRTRGWAPSSPLEMLATEAGSKSRIDRIARTAQASKERIYAHFRDKETLFREVLATDSAEFFRAISLRRGTVPDFVGDVYDLAREHPEHLRMITWARLEGFALDEPHADGDLSSPVPSPRLKRPRQLGTWIGHGNPPTSLPYCLGSAWPGRTRRTPTH